MKYPRGPSVRGGFWRLRLPSFCHAFCVATSAVKRATLRVLLLANLLSRCEAIDTGNNVMVTTWFNPSPRINRGNISQQISGSYRVVHEGFVCFYKSPAHVLVSNTLDPHQV